MTPTLPGLLAQQAATQPSCVSSLLMFAPMLVLFYFLLIRPQQKHQQELQRFRDGLKTGDEVVTAGGIHGTISLVATSTVELKVAPGTTVRVERASIVRKAAGDPAATAS